MKNKILTICLSVLLSFALWLYVITTISPNSERTYYNIPVTFQNADVLAERGLMITEGMDEAITLTLAGNRSDLNNLNESNINIFASLVPIEAPGVHSINYTVSLPGNVAGSSVSIQNGYPSNLTLKVENRITKAVDIVIDYVGSVPTDFLADKENALRDNATVEISGPESVISKIAQAKIRVDLTNRTETIAGQFPYELCDRNGNPVDSSLVTTDTEAVTLTVRIVRVKEVALRVQVVEGGGATLENTKITVEPDVIRVTGNETLLEDLDVIELGTLELGKIGQNKTHTFPILLPDGVTNETGLTEAKVTVSFMNLQTKTVNISKIQAVNVPSGMRVDMITRALEIHLRGPLDQIASVKEEDVTVTVDFSEVAVGTATVAANVQISGNYPDIGAVGTYSVSATLRSR